MEIRRLEDKDYMDLYLLIRPFYEEGHWHEDGEFSPENTMAYVTTALNAGVCWGVYDNNGLAGVLNCEITYEFDTAPRAYVTDLYIAQRARGLGYGRMLVEKIICFCKEHNCVSIYSANTGKFTKRANALHDNLFKRYGFEPVSMNLKLRL